MTGFADGPETALPAGDVTEGVVRVGRTVRRPHQDSSPVVAEYLRYLEQVGFAGAPRYLGRDRRGRDVLTFLEGRVAGDPVPAWAAADCLLPSVGRLVRSLHDASADYIPSHTLDRYPTRPATPFPAGERRIVAHRDVTPQNVVVDGDTAFALIDFDLVGWTTRSLDLANTAMHWIPLRDPRDRQPAFAGIEVARRLRLLLDGYGTDTVGAPELLHAVDLRVNALHASMRWNAEHLGGGWARMWANGVGEVIDRRAEWFGRVRAELADQLSS